MFRLSTVLSRLARRISARRPHRPLTSRPTPLRLEALEDRSVPALLGNELFPADNPWNQKITDAPVAASSTAILNNILSHYGDGRLHPDFSQYYGTHDTLYGIPYNVVHGNSTPKVNVVIDSWPDESDLLPAPIPAGAVLEGDYQDGPRVGVNNRGDSHLIVYDVDNNIAYEFYHASRPSENADGKWHASQETVWDMKTNTFRTLGWTSADAAGLSILTGLVRPDEGLPVSQGGQGVIDHAIRVTLQNSVILDQFVYPASHTANPGNTNAAILPPMGARFRLKAGVDLSQLNPQSRIIAQAMKDYGLIVADNGSNFFFSGANYAVDATNHRTLTWSDDDIQDTVRGLKSLHFSDFEVVDLTPVVTGLSVSTAPAGTSITVTGKNFSGAAGHLQVLFGAVPATTVTVVDDSHVVAVVPAGAGTVDVRVRSGVTTAANADNVYNTLFGYGTSAITPAGRFTYGAVGNQPAAITSAAAATFTEGLAGSFTVTTTGTPTAALALSGTLPAGLTFVDNGDGTGTLAGTLAAGTYGRHVVTIQATNGVGVPATQTFTLTVGQSASVPLRAVGSGAGPVASVTVYDSAGAATTLYPYGMAYRGGVHVATGDVNGDGTSDLIVAPAWNLAPVVKVYSGVDYTLLRTVVPYHPLFRGGVNVAAGDVLGLGAAQLVVGAGWGGPPVVRVYDLRTGVVLVRTIQPFLASHVYGVTVAASDGVLAVGKAANGGVVRVYDGPNLARMRALLPFGAAWVYGVNVAVSPDYLAVGRVRGGGDVSVYALSTLASPTVVQTQTAPLPRGAIGGTRVAFARSAGGAWELLTAAGPGWPAATQFWVTGSWTRRTSVTELGGSLAGVWVA
ncbi:MAG: IPT/TIG domain-containing protein [Gemmataceae bacterium]